MHVLRSKAWLVCAQENDQKISVHAYVVNFLKHRKNLCRIIAIGLAGGVHFVGNLIANWSESIVKLSKEYCG